ncbi:MAG TPA: alternative ribosome rescue aminoacyl-tRNA hydrolase ArfB [Chitinivibrionales bacterium]|jgi:ribosome-associated protein|nr:alternative ribosome rescue aminoacyl-tRNA hydrolase ArfB [Chitinivibrionales bacterium]
MIAVTPQCNIDEKELSFSFVRSGGPGGQNVNKVSTAARLRFNAAASPSLSDHVKRRLLDRAGSRATLDGEIVISASRFRTQERNRSDAIERLVLLIRMALAEPKKRRATKPTYASRSRRVESKRLHAEKKRFRRGAIRDDD